MTSGEPATSANQTKERSLQPITFSSDDSPQSDVDPWDLADEDVDIVNWTGDPSLGLNAVQQQCLSVVSYSAIKVIGTCQLLFRLTIKSEKIIINSCTKTACFMFYMARWRSG